MSSSRSRPFVLNEASLKEVQALKPNVAVIPWGATEAHNYHLPHGTDTIQGIALGEAAIAEANQRGARCILLPAIPFGMDHTQLTQAATITMRARTQAAVLYDVADSLVRQGIDRLVVLNAHGGNDFRSMIRDVSMELPIFIAQVNGYQIAPAAQKLLQHAGEHADEFETSVMLHLYPEWVAPLETAGDGRPTESKLAKFSSTPGVWAPRDWAAYTQDTGVGDPHAATAEKGEKIFAMLVEALADVLAELSKARNGDFPFVVRKRQ